MRVGDCLAVGCRVALVRGRRRLRSAVLFVRSIAADFLHCGFAVGLWPRGPEREAIFALASGSVKSQTYFGSSCQPLGRICHSL